MFKNIMRILFGKYFIKIEFLELLNVIFEHVSCAFRLNDYTCFRRITKNINFILYLFFMTAFYLFNLIIATFTG